MGRRQGKAARVAKEEGRRSRLKKEKADDGLKSSSSLSRRPNCSRPSETALCHRNANDYHLTKIRAGFAHPDVCAKPSVRPPAAPCSPA